METNSIINIVLFFLVSLLVIRIYMGLAVKLVFSKKELKNYQTNLSLVNRWFFWSTHQFIKDKYSKSEKKVIQHSQNVKAYKAIIVVLHVEFGLVLILSIVGALLNNLEKIFNYSCWVYIISLFLSFVVVSLIEIISNTRYHRNRYRRKRQ